MVVNASSLASFSTSTHHGMAVSVETMGQTEAMTVDAGIIRVADKSTAKAMGKMLS
jgi:hypothetical protein